MHEMIITNYLYEFTNYQVVINFRPRMRNINYRYDAPTLTFNINAPYRTSQKEIFAGLERFAPGLIEKAEKNKYTPAIGRNYVYIFGKKMPYLITSVNHVFPDHIEVKSQTDLNEFLKSLLKDYLLSQLPRLEKLMGTKHYRITVRDMNSRYGSNRRYTGALSFALQLVHYSGPIIDSVIIHELAHDKFFDHSKDFYALVYQYCPNYKALSKALSHHHYDYGND